MDGSKVIPQSPPPGGLFLRKLGRPTAIIAIVIWALGCGLASRDAHAAPVPAVMDTLALDSLRFQVRIPRIVAPPMNVVETLSVMIQTSGWPMAAAALKIGTDSRYIDIIGIEKGEIIDSCKWEYFRASRVNTENKVLFPKTLWSIVALAKITPDSIKPACFGLKREAVFMKLIVTSPPNFPIKDTAATIFFFWEDCRDNTLSDESGQTLLISKRIYDSFDSSEEMSGNVFPTRLGTPGLCINPRKEHHPRRTIEFYNGGLEFKVTSKGKSPSQPPLKTD